MEKAESPSIKGPSLLVDKILKVSIGCKFSNHKPTVREKS